MDTIETRSYMEAMNNKYQKDVTTFSSNESVKSWGKEKTRDFHISELEEKLVAAEDRCSVLRQQVEYMKMLYTSSHQQTVTSDEEVIKKTEDTVRNSISNPVCYRAEVDNFFNLPANMTMKPLSGRTLTTDPKDAMQLIVNEMTQSVNAIEGSVNIHSTTIEGMILSSRNQKKRLKKEDRQAPKTRKTPIVQLRRDGNKTATDKPLVRRKSLKSLGSKSKISGRSITAGKNRTNYEALAGSTIQIRSRHNQSAVRIKSKTEKRLSEKVVSDSQKLQNEAGRIPKITSSTYLLPTLSYRMKCVPKSFRPEFNFRRIPFVLGKSINKSHNIGAKIQETLSLIKLSRKELPSTGNQAKREQLTNLIQSESAMEPPLVAVDVSNSNEADSRQSKQRSPMTMGVTTDYKNYQLRTVLMNLHDEYSKMDENYDLLQKSLKENFDSEVAQKVQLLEDELNAKESEIEAFMNLYNEVSSLKNRLSSNRAFSQPNAIYRPATPSFGESTTSLKMTRLLRRIEQFQDQLKNVA